MELIISAVVGTALLLLRRRLAVAGTPRYVDRFAKGGFAVGLLIVYLDNDVDAFGTWEKVLFPLILLVVPYLAFAEHGWQIPKWRQREIEGAEASEERSTSRSEGGHGR